MHIFGGREFVGVPGDRVINLPPLIVTSTPRIESLRLMHEEGRTYLEQDDIVPFDFVQPDNYELRIFGLTDKYLENYLRFLIGLQWGQGIWNWMSDCAEVLSRLRIAPWLWQNVWPLSERSILISLLKDKNHGPADRSLEEAVGLHLVFQQMNLRFVTLDFVLYLQSQVGRAAYETWSATQPRPVKYLPRERFEFPVITIPLS